MTNQLPQFTCLIDDDSTSFTIDIDSSRSVHQLKHEIKLSIHPQFDLVPTKDIILWSVSIPDRGVAVHLDSQAKQRLAVGSASLRSVFNYALPANTIHIIVQRPQASASAAAPLLSVSEVLERPLPSLHWTGSNEAELSSTTNSRYSRTPTLVQGWSDFVTNTAARSHCTTPKLDPNLYRFDHDLSVSDEISVTSALDSNVYKILNRLSTTPRIGQASEITKVIGRPDRIGFTKNFMRAFRRLRIVIEIKTIRALSCDDLVAKYQADIALIASDQAPTNPTWRQVHQIFGYMCHNRLKYGILTTYNNTWFMKRDKGRLWISPPIRHNSTAPTLLQCYKYIMHLASRNSTNPPPPPSPPPQGPPESSSSDDGNDSSGSSYHGPNTSSRNRNQQQTRTVPRSSGRIQQIVLRLQSGFTVSAGKLNLQAFDIQELLGEGRTGSVFRAKWQEESVALKICDLYKNPEYEEEILSEVGAYEALEDLQGVCIPHFKIAGYDGGLFSIAMDIAGSPMEVDQLSHQERLEIVNGLSRIHQHGILHNDIRVSNVLVCRDIGFQFRFIDFAQSRRTSDKRELRREMAQLKSILDVGPPRN